MDEAPTRKRRPRGFRIALGVLAMLFILFVVALLLLPRFLPVGAIKGIAKTKAAELAGVDVDFQDLGFTWNGDVVLGNVTVAPLLPDGGTGPTLLTVDRVRTNVALLSLLSGRAVVQSVEVDGFSVRLVRDAEGGLNLPDFAGPRTAALPRSAPLRNAIPLAAVRAGEDPAGAPPIEVHRISLKNGVLSVEDRETGLAHDMALDFLDVIGGNLDDPFSFDGRLFPYAEDHAWGAIPFRGKAALLKNLAFNPDGEASVELTIEGVDLHPLAVKAGMGDLLQSGRMDGLVRVGYGDRTAALHLDDVGIRGAAIDLGGRITLAVPDTVTSLKGFFDTELGMAVVDEMSLSNAIASFGASARVEGIFAMADGQVPDSTLTFSGTADFTQISAYIDALDLEIVRLPALEGATAFSGRFNLPSRTPLAPDLHVQFTDGGLALEDPATGIVAGMDFPGMEFRAMGKMGDDDFELTSAITLNRNAARAILPAIAEDPVTAAMTGGIALIASSSAAEGELRLEETLVDVPSTPWSNAVTMRIPQTRITADMVKDLITIEEIRATINDAIEATVSAGSVAGIMEGKPSGRFTVNTTATLATVEEIIRPLLPEGMLRDIMGAVRASADLTMSDNAVEARLVAEGESVGATLSMDSEGLDASVASPAARLSALASVDLQRLDHIVLHSLEAGGDGATIEIRDGARGLSASGQTGAVALRAVGDVDIAAMNGKFSSLAGEMAGFSLTLRDRDGENASLASGMLSAIIASGDNHAVFPIDGEGVFAVPQFDLGMDNLRFAAAEETANLGNIRFSAVADGYVGSEQRQIVTLRKAEFAASPMAINSRGQADIGSGAFLLEYAARIAPAGLSPILRFMGLPPALLADMAVSGSVSHSDNQINSRGSVQGILQVGEGLTSPFAMDHDLSAAWDQEDRSLAIDVRRLDGSVKTGSGEAAVTMAAQQSRLFLKRGASKGLLDIRLKGTAGPTRMLALGMVGVVPQLAEYSHLLHSTRAEGVYDAWLQIRDHEASTLALSLGGFWQGAALAVDGIPYLAERGKLSAGIEGELDFRANQARITRMLLRSDSAMMQADGQAVVSLTPGESFLPDGFQSVDATLRFIMADLAQAGRVFPGLVPADLGLAGRIHGAFRATGDLDDIRVSEAGMDFQNFRVTPAPEVVLAIPAGAARFGAALSYTPEMATGSVWDIFKILSLRGGQAALTGATLNGNAIDDMSASFHLEGGQFALSSARVTIGGGSAGSLEADARIDFNSLVPRVEARWAVQNMPLPIGPSPDSITMQGSLSVQDGQASLPSFTLRTASGLVQATGAGTVHFTVDGDGIPNGLTTVQLGGRFALADLSRLAAMAQGLLPPGFRMAGAMEGAFSAAGDNADIRITDSAVQFQGFMVAPSPEMAVAIPSGTATLSASISLNLDAPATGSPYDAVRMLDVRDGRATLSGVTVMDKSLTDLAASFAFQDGVLTVQSAQVSLGGGSGGIVAAAVVDVTRPVPAVSARIALRNIPLAEFNDEINDYLSVQSGALTVPAEGDAATVAFSGFSVDEILQTLRLDNFSFVTGPVVLHTGPVLNVELDRARAMLKMTAKDDGAREISFTSISGTAHASGNGIIRIPESAPINLIGRDTADFRARGDIFADHTLDMKVMVTGKMENLISFSIPNLIPSLNNDREGSNRLISRMNASAAKGDYGVHVKGSFDQPDISGIGALAAQVLKDLLTSSGLGIIGGALDLGKDAPGAILNLGSNVLDGVLNPAETVRNAPENIIRSPERAIRGLGQAFGLGGSRNREEAAEDEEQVEEQPGRNRLQLPFGIH